MTTGTRDYNKIDFIFFAPTKAHILELWPSSIQKVVLHMLRKTIIIVWSFWTIRNWFLQFLCCIRFRAANLWSLIQLCLIEPFVSQFLAVAYHCKTNRWIRIYWRHFDVGRGTWDVWGCRIIMINFHSVSLGPLFDLVTAFFELYLFRVFVGVWTGLKDPVEESFIVCAKLIDAVDIIVTVLVENWVGQVLRSRLGVLNALAVHLSEDFIITTIKKLSIEGLKYPGQE